MVKSADHPLKDDIMRCLAEVKACYLKCDRKTFSAKDKKI
jgi:hypothetical protein